MRKKQSPSHEHQFGGDWTTAKLDVIAKYLGEYTTALRYSPSRASPFRKAYVDGFAGTGYRSARRQDASATDKQLSLFPDSGEPEQALLDGSARRALQIDPPFDKYIFIEQSAVRCAALEQLKIEFPERATAIEVRQGDANHEIRKFCGPEKDWRSRRAVMLLDPYGMQLEWKPLEAIAATQAIDLWFLFPLGIGVNRLLKKSGEVPVEWRATLDRLLGTADWYDAFYKSVRVPTLFGEQEQVVKASMDTIGRYFVERLETIFAGVAPKPGVLRNSTNSPLYLLCFAVGNPRGKDIALRIANHLLKELR